MGASHSGEKLTNCYMLFTYIYLLDRLPSVLDAATQLIFSTRHSEDVSLLLHDHHWLLVPEAIQFHLRVLTCRCLNNTSPSYLAESVYRVVNIEGCYHLRL